MLILSRRPAESIQIGPDIEVVVIETRSGQVRLGITAPKDVTILRTEIATNPAAPRLPPTRPV